MTMTKRQLIYNYILSSDKTIGDYSNFCMDMFFYPVGDHMRLKKHGCLILEKHFTAHIVNVDSGLDGQQTASKHFIFLARFCRMPYYIGTNRIVFFDEQEAMLFKLCDGDIDNVSKVIKS